ncbi:hypothetical protein KEM54_004996 [Ascosphaera aggregata]|nr:hypothetical protein KEM54_004996 [Ascosphaera aggregata]
MTEQPVEGVDSVIDSEDETEVAGEDVDEDDEDEDEVGVDDVDDVDAHNNRNLVQRQGRNDVMMSPKYMV